MYREEDDSTFTHDGEVYSLNKALEFTDDVPITKVSVRDLQWVLKYTEVDEDRVNNADLSTPVLITLDKIGRPVAIDGAHRLTKAVRTNVKTLPAKWISKRKLKQCLVEKI